MRPRSAAGAAGSPLTGCHAGQRICGPDFTGSTDIGGADADFILGGLLLDCKATTRPRQLGTAEVHQLAGYLLLDYDDTYRIDRVGLYLSRRGHLLTWTVPDFLNRLGATTTLPLLRHKLRDFLRPKHAQPIRHHDDAHGSGGRFHTPSPGTGYAPEAGDARRHSAGAGAAEARALPAPDRCTGVSPSDGELLEAARAT